VVTTVGRVVRKAGYQTVSASDGATALDEVAKAQPAIVISDVLMPPGINGFQLCRQLKAAATTRDIPVILMSGKADAADHLWAEEVGARLLMRKPLDLPRLLAEIADGLAIAR
jgi:CheY-like chemotaxis protein